MKTNIYSHLSKFFLFAGLFFILMEVVYGYFFGVWNEYSQVLQHPDYINVFMTKFSETVLFAFLSIVSLLSSIACSLNKPKQAN